ncbi:MAG: competence/damage-inducible protein A [Firmicutes bacterium]|nr:competence/damage-inducible protein A [Bacillota bacterium]
MRAEIISVGTELLLGQIVDTNAVFLSRELANLGIDLYHRTTVGDNPERLRQALEAALGRAELVITSGGLGPTADDLTKEIVAEALGLDLILDRPSLERMEAYFRQLGRRMTENNYKQALIPVGGKALPNPHGTAPGVAVRWKERLVICLPGPPHELEPMFRTYVLPMLQQEKSGVIFSRVLKISGRGESAVAEELADLLAAQSNPTVAPLASPGEVKLRLTARADSTAAAEKLIAGLEAQIRERLGSSIFGVDDETMEEVVVRLLANRGETLAVAESCTGGLLAGRLTEVPGASAVFERGVVTYSNRSKVELLGIPEEVLTACGAVSPEVARLMAAGVKEKAGTDWGIGITGIAGPGGGTVEKPVGLVYVGLEGPEISLVKKLHFPGTRSAVRRRTVQTALDLLRLELLTKQSLSGRQK